MESKEKRYRINQPWLLPGVLALIMALTSCAYPKNFSTAFYAQHEEKLVALKNDYKALYTQRPFTVLFEDKGFHNIAFEIITDSIKYVYHFNLNKPSNFEDTLAKHQFDVTGIKKLVAEMQSIHCTWITNLDYYENTAPRYLVFMSLPNKALNTAFKSESYCTLAFFDAPQPFDEKGRFLDRSDKKRKRQINGEFLYKVNDRVGYAIRKHYR